MPFRTFRKSEPEKSETAGEPRFVERYFEIRHRTEELCEPLLAEDYVIQPMLEASPPKWHLAHTTWFFETLLLRRYVRSYRVFDPRYDFLFNSYYESLGPHLDRSQRGLLCRPTTHEILNYRRSVDSAVENALGNGGLPPGALKTLEIALHHEQQHQELLLTDIKAIFGANPLKPVYLRPPGQQSESPARPEIPSEPQPFIEVPGGVHEIGHPDDAEFSYDHERPRHRIWLDPFRLKTRPVTNGEFLEFIEAGGYTDPLLWLSEGWDLVKANQWKAPLYWERHGSGWQLFTLSGLRRLEPREPVCHVSYFEADAFARWKGARLPSEGEWEIAASGTRLEGNFAESGRYHPDARNNSGTNPFQFWGDVWEWTSSAYLPYPGYKSPEGPLGEYNAKFMINQLVLRGGSCATPRSHIRPSYRNYFEPRARWQFSGFRIAHSL